MLDNTGIFFSSFTLNNMFLDNNLLKIKGQGLEYFTTNNWPLKYKLLEINLITFIEIFKNFNICLISESKLDASFPKN